MRLIHKPTGIVVACQEERSQVQNRAKCMQMLASKLYEMERERVESAVTNERRAQVGTGMRNERLTVTPSSTWIPSRAMTRS